MARISLFTICVLIVATNFIGCETWGDLEEKLETNANATVVHNLVQNIREQELVLKPRQVQSPSTATTTITYTLGKRVTGK